jgi:WD40 repeat protein
MKINVWSVCAGWLLAFCPVVEAVPTQHAPKPTAPSKDHYGDPLPEGAVARLGSIRFHHEGGLIAAAFSPDRQMLVVAGFKNAHIKQAGLSVRFWDTATGKELSRLTIEDQELTGLAFAPDAKTVFVGRYYSVEQYDRQSGKLLRRFAELAPSQLGFAVSADGQWLATCSQPPGDRFEVVVHVWEIATGQQRMAFKGQHGFCTCQWSADGKRLLSASTSSLCAWDVATGKKLGEIANEEYNVALASDGATAAVQDQSGQTKVVKVATGQTVCTFKTHCGTLAFTPDSKALLTVPANGEGEPARLWDATSGKQIRAFPAQHEARQRLVGFSADGKQLATMASGWHQDGWLLLWDATTGAPLQHNGSHRDRITGIVYSPDGRLVASGSLDRTVRLWDPATGKQLACLEGHRAGIKAIAFAPDGKTLASSSNDGTIHLWDVAKGAARAELAGPEGGAVSLTFSADGKTLLVAGATPPVLQIWDIGSLKMTVALSAGREGSVFAVGGDAKVFLSANGEGLGDWSREVLRLWKLPTGKHLMSVELPPSDGKDDRRLCLMAALSSDGRLIAASHRATQGSLLFGDHTLSVFERATGQELHRIPGGQRHALWVGPGDHVKVHTLAFSPSARLLAAGHGGKWGPNRPNDTRITLWDMLTGELVALYEGHANEVACVSFSPDAEWLASGSADHTVLIWKVTAPSAFKMGAAKPTAEQLQKHWDDLKGDAQTAKWAMVALLSHPEASIKWMAERLKPAPPVDTERIAGLIRLLDSPTFKDRQKATEALAALGEVTELQLQKVLAGKPSLEMRQRAELLLAKLKTPLLSAEQRQVARALAVLEWIGSVEALKLLAALAAGAPEARLTQIAQDALIRVKSPDRK